MLSILLSLLLFSLQGFAAPSWNKPADIDVAAQVSLAPPPITDHWIRIDSLYTTIYAEPSDRKTALILARHASERIPEIAEQLNVPAGDSIEIYITPSADEFHRLQPGHIPDWADGTAWPHNGWIFLHSPRARSGIASPLTQVLDHELAHILLGRAFGARPVPQWLQEGVAQIVAKEYTLDKFHTLSAGTIGDNLLSIHELSRGFPENPFRAKLAYAQSADLVSFIFNNYGESALQTLIVKLSAGATIDDALTAATGYDAQQLDAQWRGELSQIPLWLQPLTSDTALLTFGALVFFAAAFRTKRKRHSEKEARAEADKVRARISQKMANWGPLTTPWNPYVDPYPANGAAFNGHRNKWSVLE